MPCHERISGALVLWRGPLARHTVLGASVLGSHRQDSHTDLVSSAIDSGIFSVRRGQRYL
jgi:hypothetical protein